MEGLLLEDKLSRVILSMRCKGRLERRCSGASRLAGKEKS